MWLGGSGLPGAERTAPVGQGDGRLHPLHARRRRRLAAFEMEAKALLAAGESDQEALRACSAKKRRLLAAFFDRSGQTLQRSSLNQGRRKQEKGT